MNEDGHVLVIGAATVDVKGRPDTDLVQSSSVPGYIRHSLGGVARNIGENLARLEVNTILLTAVGDDAAGERILGQAAGAGIDISEAVIVEGGRTGSYVALLDRNGAMNVAIDDMGIINALTPDYLHKHRRLFQGASIVVIDANLTPEAILAIVQLCEQYQVPLCADPTSSTLAERLCPHLESLYMIAPNIPETSALSDAIFDATQRDKAQAAARKLVTMGVDFAVITLGEHGVVYADAETQGHIPAISTEIVDQTGAGDAMTSAIIFGLREDIPLDECVRLGVTAATLTLRSRDSVRRDLSVDLLYDELVI